MALLQRQAVFGLPRMGASPRVQARKFACTAKKSESQDESESLQTVKGVAAAALAASFIFASAGAGPAEAARSGGRAGGSSFRSAPRASAPRAQGGGNVTNKTYNNYNVSPSPPLFGGFGGFGGGYGFGGPGISFFPTFAVPIGGGIGGGIFQFFFVAIIASTLFGAIQAIFRSGRRRNDYDD